MEVTVGKYAGFCPGVMNSVTKAQEAVDKYDELYCLGELIHNKIVVSELEENEREIEVNKSWYVCILIYMLKSRFRTQKC